MISTCFNSLLEVHFTCKARDSVRFLTAGMHPMRIEYFQRGGDGHLYFKHPVAATGRVSRSQGWYAISKNLPKRWKGAGEVSMTLGLTKLMISVLIFKDINPAVDFDFLCNLISGSFISGCCSFQAYQFADSLQLSDCPWHCGSPDLVQPYTPKDPIPKELPCRGYVGFFTGKPRYSGPDTDGQMITVPTSKLGFPRSQTWIKEMEPQGGCSIEYTQKSLDNVTTPSFDSYTLPVQPLCLHKMNMTIYNRCFSWRVL